MALIFIMGATLYLYIALACAISRNIDDDIPFYTQKYWLPFQNFVYKSARIGWAILCCLVMYPIFWVWVALWIGAYLWKKFWVYFYYWL